MSSASPKKKDLKAKAAKKEAPKAEEPKKEVPKADAPKDEVAKAEEPKQEVAKAEEPKAEEAKAEEAKAGEAKPEEGKPEEGKPEEAKPEEGKPEEGKPEEGTPEEGKGEEGKKEGERKKKKAKEAEAAPVVGGSDGARPDDKGIRKRSKVPGVMITQFMEDLPEGMTTPDFTRKPIAVTIQEGKCGAFKAIITGTPTPTVTWSRANADIIFHPEVCLQKYNESSHEHTLEFPKVNPEDADTYKCYATNEYGRAVCTVVLNVIEVGFSMTKELQRTHGKDLTDLRKGLRKINLDGSREEKQMEPEEKVWELLLSADKRDYERICAEYGITDFRGMLKKLNEMKREREEQIAEFVSRISTLKHIEVNHDDCATIELDMDLKDPNSKIYLYKNGVMVPFSIEDSETMKHSLKQVGKKYIFTIKNLGSDDAGLYSVDVEGVNVFSTDFKVPEVDFAVKIQEVKAEEREDALFQCVLTAPMTEVKWFGKNTPLSNSDKHEIIVSEDKLIHKLIIRDCLPLDAGIYAAVAGIKSCNAWLVVEADRDTANMGRKAARKTTMAGGGTDEELMRIAKEQQEKYQKEMEEKMERVKKLQEEREAAETVARAEAELARKASAEEKAAAQAAARSKRPVAGQDGAVRKTKTKDGSAGDDAEGAVGAETDGGIGRRVGSGGGGAKSGDGAQGVGGVGAAGTVGDGQGRGVGGQGRPGARGLEDQAAAAAHGGGVGGRAAGLRGVGGQAGDAHGGVGGQAGGFSAGVGGQAGLMAGGVGGQTRGMADGPVIQPGGMAGGLAGQPGGMAGSLGGQPGGMAGGLGGPPGLMAGGLEIQSGGMAGGLGGQPRGPRGQPARMFGGPGSQPGGMDGGLGSQPGVMNGGIGGQPEGIAGGPGGQIGGMAGGLGSQPGGTVGVVGGKSGGMASGGEGQTGNAGDQAGGVAGGARGQAGGAGGGARGKADRCGTEGVSGADAGVGGGTTVGEGGDAARALGKVVGGASAAHQGGVDGKGGEYDSRDDEEYKRGREEEGEKGAGQKHGNLAKDGQLSQHTGNDNTDEEIMNEQGEESGKKEKRLTKKKLLPDEPAVDTGVHIQALLSDCKAIIGDAAELECKVSKVDCKGKWYKDGVEIHASEGIKISKEGGINRLKILKVTEESAGKYKFEVDGRKTEAMVIAEDPPRCEAEELEGFKAPATVKKGHKATFKLHYTGREPIKVQWYLEGEELSDDSNIKIENTEGCSRLLVSKLQRKDSGEVKIKLKNDFGTVEAFSQLVVLDKPTPPLGPLEIIEASSSAVEFKWRPPKDNGGCKIENFLLERQQVGRNTWKKVGPIGPVPKYRDSDVDHGKRYCYRIRVETEMGTSEMMETEDIQAGTKAYPGPPSAPKIVSAFSDCITVSWSPPSDAGGTEILGYNLEKRKKGSNLWSQVNPPNEMIRAKTFPIKDVVDGVVYEFRVSAINNSGAGEPSNPSEHVYARDPKKPPGKVLDLKVTDSTYTTLSLSWNKPKVVRGVEDETKGYFVEVRPAENTVWDRCNNNAITMNCYTVKGMKSLGMYWVRVLATNDGGDGPPQELDNYIMVMPPPVRPRFTDAKIKSFMIVRAGHSARFNINFEASPWPEVIWLKDGTPVPKKVTISNAEGNSQLLLASAERTDTGIYTIIVKNIVGQETFSVEIRVTDEPKPPGPLDLDENVPGTVTLSWAASPDEKRDDRLHYMVTKRDSVKRSWHTIGDHIFNNRFTACNIMPGREYKFRVYAKNDMGCSKPVESPKWIITAKKEKFTVKVAEAKSCDLQCPPKFLVPLKLHTAPEGYECYMSCAVKGDPTPHVTWLRDNISLNTNTNYFISNTCGVCSMLILRVGSKDTGEYKVVAENSKGRAECSTKLTVRE